MTENSPETKQAEAPKQESAPQNTHSTKANVSEQIKELKNKLNEINAEKEKWFAQRESFSKQIKQEIGKIKESATTRDSLSSTVKEHKEKRRTLNKQISEKIKIVREMQEKAKQTQKKGERVENPEMLKKRIAGLEKRIETEGLSFDKEKKVMKEIKDLKKKYDAVKDNQVSWGEIRKVSKEIAELKKQADAAHQEVQKRASTSQEQHESLVQTSKHIDELKKKEREAHAKFVELKKEFTTYNEQLKGLLPQAKRISLEKEQKRKEKQAKVEAQQKQTMLEKAQEVEKKIKSGKKVKLTMEDLIAFQGKQE